MSGLRTGQGRYFGLFVGAMVLSIPTSLWVGGSVRTFMDFLTAKLPYVLILVGTGFSEEELDWLLRGIVISIILFGAAILGGGGWSVDGRLFASSTYDPNDIAMMAAVSIPFALRQITGSSMTWRYLGLAGLGSALLLVLQTGSRGGALAVGAVVLSQLFLFPRGISRRMKLGLIASVCIGLIFAPGVFMQRLASLGEVQGDYNVTEETGRIEIWKRGIGYYIQHPLTGVGIGQFNSAEGKSGESLVNPGEGFKWSTAHNSLVLAAAELGSLGLVGFLGLFLPLFPLAWRMRRMANHNRSLTSLADQGEAIAIATIGFLVAGFFLSATYEPVAMTLAAFGMCYAAIVKRGTRLSRRSPAPNPARGATPQSPPLRGRAAGRGGPSVVDQRRHGEALG